ncbi:Uncharacterised protein [Mycobacteroides abscessus subsp. abscessus]|nr:Uncharacterised protein [Mycobacteroides abscessus subsp. abscessus]
MVGLAVSRSVAPMMREIVPSLASWPSMSGPVGSNGNPVSSATTARN